MNRLPDFSGGRFTSRSEIWSYPDLVVTSRSSCATTESNGVSDSWALDITRAPSIEAIIIGAIASDVGLFSPERWSSAEIEACQAMNTAPVAARGPVLPATATAAIAQPEVTREFSSTLLDTAVTSRTASRAPGCRGR